MAATYGQGQMMYPPSGYGTKGSVSSGYSPSVSSTGQYPPYQPGQPPPPGFITGPSQPPGLQYQSRPAYTSSPHIIMIQSGSPEDLHEPLIAKSSSSKTVCLFAYGLIALGIVFGFFLAIFAGVFWRPASSYGYPN